MLSKASVVRKNSQKQRSPAASNKRLSSMVQLFSWDMPNPVPEEQEAVPIFYKRLVESDLN